MESDLRIRRHNGRPAPSSGRHKSICVSASNHKSGCVSGEPRFDSQSATRWRELDVARRFGNALTNSSRSQSQWHSCESRSKSIRQSTLFCSTCFTGVASRLAVELSGSKLLSCRWVSEIRTISCGGFRKPSRCLFRGLIRGLRL